LTSRIAHRGIHRDCPWGAIGAIFLEWEWLVGRSDKTKGRREGRQSQQGPGPDVVLGYERMAVRPVEAGLAGRDDEDPVVNKTYDPTIC